VTGVDANPEAYEHARLRYTRPGVRFVRDLVESFEEPCDAVVFLQTIEHVQNPGEILDHLRSMLRSGGKPQKSRVKACQNEPAWPFTYGLASNASCSSKM